MAVTMADIQNLRKRTGAGMMDCKNALNEAAGDFEKAIEIIRKKGQAFAAKRGDRDASEGCVLAAVNGEFGAIVALKCETDFVAINADFVDLTKSILNAALDKKPASLDELNAVEVDGRKIADLVTDRMGITGEKMELGAYETISAPYVVAYIHPGNKLATIVGFNKKDVDAQVAKDVAMQIAAMNPVALIAEEVSEAIREREMNLAREKAREAGKPENLLDRIAEGALQKFYKEFTLLEQEFVKNPKQTIGQYLAQTDKELAVVGFKRFTLNAE
ncbi:elongation factor Ts [Dysgonomonas sp. PH5-45]|uniref:translation elongation factor Ts n=1 Tax=unclassified Dysgonomonas TaxID=2630389 RepID=UPI002476B268|nr:MULTISPECIES: translation elongation factor Ts [unclassified Dysgonomonas]MDH6354556.1 elongation factor Ts [Dysgonomonas sp. PH5-45]MDH6387388.1 elongation factor Ts [Dysgonomonas sp. PH5-37]